MAKIVKGSALITDDDSVIFTPYNCNPSENSKWKTIAATANGVLKRTDEVIQMRVTVPIEQSTKLITNKMMNNIAELMAKLLTANLQKTEEPRPESRTNRILRPAPVSAKMEEKKKNGKSTQKKSTNDD